MYSNLTTNSKADMLRQKNALLEQNRLLDATATAILFSDGCVNALAYNEETKRRISYFSEVVSVAAAAFAVFGLCKDGTVISSRLVDGFFLWKNKNEHCIPGWNDIVAISGGGSTSVAGLRKDGTVLLYDCDEISLNRSAWKDIVQISFGGGHIVGLKKDGTVVAAGENDKGECNVADWKDIVHVSAGTFFTVGVKADGTVVAVGDNTAGQCDVSEWRNIERVSAGVRHTVGIGGDGKVVSTVYRGPMDVYGGQCDVAQWSELDVVEISAGSVQTIGVRRDGKVISTVNKLKGVYANDDQFSRLFRVVGCQLFDNYENLSSEREVKFAQRAKKRELYEREIMGVCRNCGGKFKGLFSKVCTSCGQKKDY